MCHTGSPATPAPRLEREDRFAAPLPKVIRFGPSPDAWFSSSVQFHCLLLREDVHDAAGLGRLGPEFYEQRMRDEWVRTPDAQEIWAYVAAAVPSPVPVDDSGCARDEGHGGMTPDDFLRAPPAVQAGLALPHVLALRLYTGDGYRLLNRYRREQPRKMHKLAYAIYNYYCDKADAPPDPCVEPEDFPVTSYVLDWAVMLLATFTPALRLYRGLSGQLPEGLVQEGKSRPIERACMSTTANAKVATGPGSSFTGNVVLVVEAPAGSHDLHDEKGAKRGTGLIKASGAQVQWVSQYPSEEEILYPSHSVLRVQGVDEESGSRTCVRVSLMYPVYRPNPSDAQQLRPYIPWHRWDERNAYYDTDVVESL